MKNRIPVHVPAELVRDFDHHRDPILSQPTVLQRNPVFWSPAHGGYWVLTRSTDIREVLRDTHRFSNRQGAMIPAASWPRPLIPQELDPPDHGPYRAILMRYLTADRTTRVVSTVRAAGIQLIDHMSRIGRCDLVTDISRPLQMTLLAALLGMTTDDTDPSANWFNKLLQQPDLKSQSNTVYSLMQFLNSNDNDQNSSRQPEICGLLTALQAEQVHGRPLSTTEAFDISFLLAMSSVDTVASSLSFCFRFLAEHPEHQDRLRREPAIAQNAADELLRLNSVVSIARSATQDTVVRDVLIREGDRLLLCLALANLDGDRYADPYTCDFARPHSNGHVAFGLGHHRCVGAQIARQVIADALREFHGRIPEYQLNNPASLDVNGGTICSLTTLPLNWNPNVAPA